MLLYDQTEKDITCQQQNSKRLTQFGHITMVLLDAATINNAASCFPSHSLDPWFALPHLIQMTLLHLQQPSPHVVSITAMSLTTRPPALLVVLPPVGWCA